MQVPHKLDFNRMRRLGRIRDDKLSAHRRQLERGSEIHSKIQKTESRIRDAEKVLAEANNSPVVRFIGSSNNYVDAPLTPALREGWEKTVADLKRELTELEAEQKDLALEQEMAGEESSAAIALFESCRKFKARQEMAEGAEA